MDETVTRDPQSPAKTRGGPHGEGPRGQKPFPGFWQAVALVVCTVLGIMGTALVLSIVSVAAGREELTTSPWFLGLVNALAIGGVLAVATLVAGARPASVFSLRRFRPSALAPLLAATAGLNILASEADNLLRTFFPAPDWLMAPLLALAAGGWGAFFALVIVAPVTEEALFRGLILRGFLGRYRTGVAVAASAALFALFHVNPYQFVAAFVLGLLLAWVFVRTRSLWPCIVGHAFANGLGFAITALDIDIPGYTRHLEAGAPVFQPLWFDALGGVLAVAGWLGLAAMFRRRDGGAAG
jgi:hypothetical protein